MSYRLVIKVAGMPISIISNSIPIEKIDFGEIYKNFIFKGNKAKINIYVHYGELPKVYLKDKRLIVGMKNIWKLYSSANNQIFIINAIKKNVSKINYIGCKIEMIHLKSMSINSPSHRIAIFEPGLTKGNIYVKCSRHNTSFPNPLDFPLSELLAMDWLSSRQGSLFHGCAVMDGERGYLFLGFSGHGKSTMAKLWRNQCIILHDDRVILRKIKSRFYAFASPWYGKYASTSKGALIDKIFFIRHGLKNRTYRQNKLRTILMLLTYSFRPLWNRKGIEQNLGFCTELAQEVPSFILDFIPDSKIVDYIRGLK